MKTLKDLKEAITRIQSIDKEGLLRKFAREQALINIELIKPYTDKYDLIVRFLITGKDAAAAFAATASADTYDYVDAYAAYAAAAAAAAAAGYDTVEYTKAVESLNTLAKEHKL